MWDRDFLSCTAARAVNNSKFVAVHKETSSADILSWNETPSKKFSPYEENRFQHFIFVLNPNCVLWDR